jgi:uncharacterized protein (TIGR02453 family)
VTAGAFPGFPPEAVGFLRDLKANNDRDWFAAHRDAYDRAIRGPAEAFVAAAAPRLEAIAGRPVTAKIYRVHRDVRFSKDKSPYNAHLHIGFAVAPRRGGDGRSASGFYFGLETERLLLGAGAFEFPGAALDRYRAAAAAEPWGRALAALLVELTSAGFRLSEPDLKRVPAPYAADHPQGELLRRKGLAAWREITERGVIESPAVFEESMATFRTLAPLNRWIDDALDGG